MRMTRRRRQSQRSVDSKKRGLHTAVMGGIIAMMATPAYAVPANDVLPSGGQFMGQSSGSILASNGVMDVNQFTQNAVVKWDSFNVGANATVNFNYNNSMDGAYRILNYSKNGGLPSEIFGRMKAGDMADVWLVNPNGVLIGKGAQIDVGYLHLASHNMTDDMLRSAVSGNASVKAILDAAPDTHTPGELMSLGNLYVNQVTFDGDRVVVDFDKLHTFSGKRVQLGDEGYLDEHGNAHKTKAGADAGSGDYITGVYIGEKESKLDAFGNTQKLVNNTTDFAKKADAGITAYLNGGEHTNYLEVGDHAHEIVAGYSVYDKDAIGAHGGKGTYENSGKWRGIYASIADLDNTTGQFHSRENAERVGFAWVEDSTQLERIGEGKKTLARDYALKDGIAAVNTREMNNGLGFKPIGYDTHGTTGTTTTNVTPFTGKFDGLGYDIYGLTINRADENDVGLFGSTKDAIIRNVSLVSGSIVGNEGVGGIVGHAVNTKIENVRNSARVLGVNNVGGIAGYMAGNSVLDGGYNAALIRGNQDVGGIVGKMDNSQIIGNTYNTGTVRGIVNFKLADTNYGARSADDLTQAVYAVDNKNKVGSLITGYTTTNKTIYNGGAVTSPDVNQSSAKGYYITSVNIDKFKYKEVDPVTGAVSSTELSAVDLGADAKKKMQEALTTGDGFKPGSRFTLGDKTYVVSDVVIDDTTNHIANDVFSVKAVDGTGDTLSVALKQFAHRVAASGKDYDSYKYEFVLGNKTTATDDDRVLMGGGSSNIGGIAGSAKDSAIGNPAHLPDTWGERENNFYNGVSDYLKDSVYNTFQIYNGADVRGGNTVGGIMGKSENSDMQNLRNEGNILAVGYKMSGDYIYSDRNGSSTLRNSGSINISNAGGIVGEASGSSIADVLNEGDVTTDTDIRRQAAITSINKGGNPYGRDVTKIIDTEYYVGGNVGGIAGTITGTSIAGATNTENKVFGAHNVGGIVGMMSSSHVSDSMNDGGRIIGTGAVKDEGVFGTVIPEHMYDTFYYDNAVVENITIPNDQRNDMYIIGNVGGIAGYMYDDPRAAVADGNVHSTLKDVRNRGEVSPQELLDPNSNVALYDVNMGVNIGGVVGKVLQPWEQHQSTVIALKAISGSTGSAAEIKSRMMAALGGTNTYNGALISGAANTGKVTGIRAVGGVAGQAMYATLANSYNMGNVGASAAIVAGDGGTSSDIGGVVGDATGANDNGRNNQNYGMYIYNVYNSGVVGDSTYNLYGRHMGGVAGIFTGNIEASYNTGDIYNASDNTGGLVGYMIAGNLNNSFNAGNITVSTRPGATTSTSIGGIAGVVNVGALTNVYNLGVLRSFNNGEATSVIGGIASRGYGRFTIDNAYSTGELGAYINNNTGANKLTNPDYVKGGTVFAIGPNFNSSTNKGAVITNSYLIRPADAPDKTADYTSSVYNVPTGDVTDYIGYNDRYDITKYGGFDFTTYTDGAYTGAKYTDTKMQAGDDTHAWRMYHYVDTDISTVVDGETRNIAAGQAVYLHSDKNFYDKPEGATEAKKLFAISTDASKHVRGTLPTLNAILPGGYLYYRPYNKTTGEGHEDILYTQIGNEYNPVTTFVQLRDDRTALNLDFEKLAKVSTPGARDGIVVNNGNLDITKVTSDAYFSGVYGATGSVNVQAASSALNVASDAAIYGKDVTLKNTAGDINLLGNIYAYDGDVTLKGKNVDVFGSILSGSKYYTDIPAGSTTQPLYWPDGTPLISKDTVDGKDHYFAEIQDVGRTVDHGENYQAVYGTTAQNNAAIMNPNQAIHNKSYLYQKSLEITKNAPGDIVISTDLDYTKEQTARPVVNDGKINLSFGTGGTGRVRTDGNLTLVARDVEVDSDISVGLTRTGYASTGSVFKIIADNAIFDVSNIGSFGSTDGIHQSLEEAKAAKIRLLMFMAHFANTDASALNNKLVFEAVEGGKADAKLALNMYGGYERLAGGTYRQVGENELNLKKYNLNPDDGQYYELYKSLSGVADVDSETALFEFLPKLNVYNGTDGEGEDADKRVAQQYSYTNIKNAEQLKSIQTYMVEKKSSAPMHLNWLLRNNIDASDIDDFHTIGNGINEWVNGVDTGIASEFTGKFNGNGYDLNSLTVHDTDNNVGLFTTIGQTGIVSDLNINASRLEGNGTRIGLIAGTNKGIIDTVKTFGNTVKDNEKYVSNDPHFIGGLVGLNQTTGFINNVSVEDIVYSERTTGLADVGGISGLNAGIIYQSTGKSDASVADGGATSLGGITGVNTGILGAVYATGVTNGLYDRTVNNTKEDYVGALNVGGIAGENRTVFITRDGVAYTSDVVYRTKDKHGDYVVDPLTGLGEVKGGGLIRDAYNDSQVTGWSNVGGVIGTNFGVGDKITNNVDTTATNNVAGKAYYISNAADVKGGDNVGGLVGVNNGTLKGEEELTWRDGIVRTEQKNAAGDPIYGMLTTSAASGIGAINLDDPDALTDDQFAKLKALAKTWDPSITDSSSKADVLKAAQGILTGLFHQKYIIGTSTAQAPDPQVLFGRNTGRIEAARGMKQATEYDAAGTPTKFTYSTGTNVGGLIGISQEKGDVKYLLNGKASSVYGFQNVGGIIGKNEGVLQESRNMMEDNEISGIIHVGGVVGENAPGGVIYGVKNENKFNITVNDDYFDTKNGLFKDIADGNTTVSTDKKTITIKNESGTGTTTYNSPKYFGGVLGHNAAAAGGKAAGIVADAENFANVNVSDAEFVGGIIGLNEGTMAEKKQYIVLTGTNRGKLVDTEPAGTDGVDYYTVKGQYINYGAVGAQLAPIPTNPTVTNHTPAGGTIIDKSKDTTDIKVDKNTGEVTVTEKHFNSQNQLVNEVVTKYVAGTSRYVGGIIGNNSSTLENVDLVNHASGLVMGKEYVGGIVGSNVGSIIGARDDGNTGKGNYYEDLVYNNGAIVATGNYAGGIAGQNTGDIKLAYNTGTVMSTKGDHVGGIVGQNNGGNIQEVFSSLAANDFIEGGSYVGGIAGENKTEGTKRGTLKNTYSIGSVTGKDKVGNLVGSNSGDVTYSYSTATNGNLIGSGNNGGEGTYTYNSSDKTATGHNNGGGYLNAEQRKVGANYVGYADQKSADGNDIWKFYDGVTTPILKNFLTNVYYTGDPATLKLVYNADTQGVIVTPEENTNRIKVTKKDGEFLGYIYSIDQKGTHADADFLGTYTGDVNTDLIIGNQNAKNAGEYTMFSSQQIKTVNNANHGVNGLGVNNLGYNFVTLTDETKPVDPAAPPPDPTDPNYKPPVIENEEITFEIQKKVLTITGNEVHRTYGDQKLTNGTSYGQTITGWEGGEDFTQGITVGANPSANDTAIKGYAPDRTANASVAGDPNRTYSWTNTATMNRDQYEGLNNYTFAVDNDSTTTNYNGTSVVDRAKLTVNMNDFNVLYGDEYSDTLHTITVKDGEYDHRNTGEANLVKKQELFIKGSNGLTNGDSDVNKIVAINGVNDEGFTDRGNGITGTADVGKHDLYATGTNLKDNTLIKDGNNNVTGGVSADGNYDVTINKGSVNVVKTPVVTIDPNDPNDPDLPKDPNGNPIPPWNPDKDDPGYDPDDPNTWKPDPDKPFNPDDPDTWNPDFKDKYNPDKVYVFGNVVERTYGDDKITSPGGDYKVDVLGNIASWDKDVKVNMTDDPKKDDGAIINLKPGQLTQNSTDGKDPYKWSTGVAISGDNKDNYSIATGDEVTANSLVHRAQLNVTLNDFAVLYGDKYPADKINTAKVDTAGNFAGRTDTQVSKAETYLDENKVTGLKNGDNSLDKIIKITDVDNKAFIERDGITEKGTADVNSKDKPYGLYATGTTLTDTKTENGHITSGVSADNNYVVNITHGNVNVVAKPVTTIDPNDPSTWPTKPVDPNNPDGPQVVIPPFTPDKNDPGYDPSKPETWKPSKPSDPSKPPFDPNNPGTWNPDFKDNLDPDKVYVYGDVVERTYGDKTINPNDPTKPHDYTVGLIGQPEWDKDVIKLTGTPEDGALTKPTDPTDPKVTNSATKNPYQWESGITTNNNPNYRLDKDSVTANSIVNKRPLTIKIDDHGIVMEGTQRPIDGSVVIGGVAGDLHVGGKDNDPTNPHIANGDFLNQIVGWDYETNRPIYDELTGAAGGTHGAFVVGTGIKDFTGLAPEIYENYDITILPGYGHLGRPEEFIKEPTDAYVYEWGRMLHYRERKAETNFTAGGGDFFNDTAADDGISHVFDDILEANMIDIRPDGTVEIAEYDDEGNLIADGEHVYDKDGNIVAGVAAFDDEDENEEDTEE